MRFDQCDTRFEPLRARNHTRPSHDGYGYYLISNPEPCPAKSCNITTVNYNCNHKTGYMPYSPFRMVIASHRAIEPYVCYSSSQEELRSSWSQQNLLHPMGAPQCLSIDLFTPRWIQYPSTTSQRWIKYSSTNLTSQAGPFTLRICILPYIMVGLFASRLIYVQSIHMDLHFFFFYIAKITLKPLKPISQTL